VDFRFIDNEIYLPVSVNGQPQQGFLFDTGSTNAIDTGKAQALRLKVEMAGAAYGGEGEAAGVGGVSRTVVFGPSQFAIGSLRPRVSGATISLAESGSAVQEHVAGAIGNPILKQFVVTFDYAHRVVYFEKNAAFGKPDAGDENRPESIAISRGGEGWLGIVKLSRRPGDQTDDQTRERDTGGSDQVESSNDAEGFQFVDGGADRGGAVLGELPLLSADAARGSHAPTGA
jgi:hypothetical protein